jgi:hypothetical protein
LHSALFEEVGDRSILDALKALDANMRDKKLGHLISKKRQKPFFGRKVQVGQVGVWNRNGLLLSLFSYKYLLNFYFYVGKPVVSIRPGSFWNFSLVHKFTGT